MRARTVPHVEYEILQVIRNEVDLSEVKEKMVPEGDDVAEKRFDTAMKQVLKLILNLEQRRKHRLPKDHVDYERKEEREVKG